MKHGAAADARAGLGRDRELLVAGGLPGRARNHLDTILGVGTRAAQIIIAEIGADMSVFPTAAHLASWVRVCPGSNITGGKRKSGFTGGGSPWLRDILGECAWSATQSSSSPGTCSPPTPTTRRGTAVRAQFGGYLNAASGVISHAEQQPPVR